MLSLGQASGHDFQFHLSSWLDVAQQWRAAVLFPRWAEWANYGFGEPRFIFYPPASWLLGAGLGSVLPWRIVPGLVLWIGLVIAGLSMFHLARRWMPAGAAMAAAVFFAANPYHLVIVYYRSDFAELLASALFPLLFAFSLNDALSRPRKIVATGVVFAGIWLCNAPAAVIVTYALGITFLFRAIRLKSLRPCVDGALSMAVGFGLAAFYILPAAFERRWVNIEQALAPELAPDHNFLFARSSDKDFMAFNWKVSVVCIVVMCVCLLAAIAARRGRRLASTVWEPLALLAAVSVALMFPFSLLVWRYAPELRFVQFPWRWLIPLNVSCWFFSAAATARWRRRAWIWAGTALCLAVAASAMIRTCWWDSEDIPVLSQAIDSGRGYEGTDEYSPLGCDHYSLAENARRAEVYDSDSDSASEDESTALEISRWAPEEKQIHVKAAAPTTVAIKLVQYPAWQADINGRPANTQSAPEAAQMLVAMPPGSGTIRIRFIRTPDRVAGAVISILAAGALISAGLILGCRGRAKPSS
jgi:hypothetical protein